MLLYSQNFNALTTGNLNGQDGWASDVAYQVQASVVQEGAKAISRACVAGALIVRTITAVTQAVLTVYMRKGSVAAGTQYFTLKNGANTRCSVRLTTDGNIAAFNNDASPAYDTLQAYSAGTFYKITFDFDTATGKYNVFVNDVLKITQATMLSTGAIDRLGMETDGSGDTAYWDNIELVTPDAGLLFSRSRKRRLRKVGAISV